MVCAAVGGSIAIGAGANTTGVATAGGAASFAAATTAAATGSGFLFLKHCRQSTGRPCVGLKGTVVSMPHSEHWVRVSVREMPAAAGPLPGAALAPAARRDLHGLQRLGSFLKFLSTKNSCSPAVKTNSPPQSTQVRSRSTNSIHFPHRAEKEVFRSAAFLAQSKTSQAWIM